jgi:hypothetical protein
MKTLKMSKTSWLILSAGIFVVIVISLFLTHSQKLQEQDQLDDELSVAEMRLGKLQVQASHEQEADLERQLDEIEAQILAARAGLRQTVESIDVTDKFFAIAQSCGVEITSLTSSSIKSEKLGDVDSSKITLGIVAAGEVDNLISFIIKLNNDFTTGIVNAAQISVPGSACEGEPSVNIVVAVHAFEGD